MRLIDSDMLTRMLTKERDRLDAKRDDISICRVAAYEHALALIAQMPDFGDQVVPHGRWFDTGMKNSRYRCAWCCYHVPSMTPHCPNCGAKMEEEAEHDLHPDDE